MSIKLIRKILFFKWGLHENMKNLYLKGEVVTPGGRLQKNLKWEGAASKKVEE